MAAGLYARQTLEEASTPAQSRRPTPKHKFEGHEDPIWDFVFLHDNIHIVSGSEDGTMRKWNCDTGLVVGEPWKSEGGGRIYALALSPNGKMIACGREDGSVQRWYTDGEMIAGVWTGHSRVRSLSWSPSGDHLASGSYDGTIIIRKVESGKVEVGPIKTKQKCTGCLLLDIHLQETELHQTGKTKRFASGTPRLASVSSAPSKTRGTGSGLWCGRRTAQNSIAVCTSEIFARVFDSKSGLLLHSFNHDRSLWSIALSPTNNILACVGNDVAQLWDTESLQPLGEPFRQDSLSDKWLNKVSFSQNGRYLAYGGQDAKLTLWMVEDIAAPKLLQQGDKQSTQQDTRSNSPSSSCLDADATGGDGIIDVSDDPYNDFFQSSQTLTSDPPQPPNLIARRFWNTLSRHRSPADDSVPRERPKRSFFTRRARPKSPLEPAITTPNQPTSDGKVRAGEDDDEGERDDDISASKLEQGKGKQREGSLADAQSPPVPALLAELDSEENQNLWRRLIGARGKDPTSINMAPAMKRPEVVEVYAVRGFQGYVAMKRRKKASAITYNAPLAATHTSGSSQPGSSSQAGPAQAGALLQASSGQGGLSSPSIVAHGTQHLQIVGGSSSHTSGPSHFVTSHDSDSRSSIEGSCNRFLDRICFPRGH